MTRGLRNNNPGNIRHSATHWRGMREKQTDAAFVQFDTMAWGYRALLKTLRTYSSKRGCVTVSDYIKRWAPENENNTRGYILRVCRDMGVMPDFVPDLWEKSTAIAFAAAISAVENGRGANMKDVEEGWNLL